MRRRHAAPRRGPGTQWLERLAWNSAALAALLVMILILLSSLQWLDEISPRPENGLAPVVAPKIARDEPKPPATRVAGVRRSSG